MSNDKAIIHGKDKRKPYRGCKEFDVTCRNHGSDVWCRNNRTYQQRREQERMKDMEV